MIIFPRNQDGNGPSPQMDQVKLRDRSRGANTFKALAYMAKTISIGRDAKTGRFIPVKEAERRPSTTVVEKVKVGPVKHRNK